MVSLQGHFFSRAVTAEGRVVRTVWDLAKSVFHPANHPNASASRMGKGLTLSVLKPERDPYHHANLVLKRMITMHFDAKSCIFRNRILSGKA
jgi:hypothetical protein